MSTPFADVPHRTMQFDERNTAGENFEQMLDRLKPDEVAASKARWNNHFILVIVAGEHKAGQVERAVSSTLQAAEMPRCFRCRHFVQFTENAAGIAHGECRRYPPTFDSPSGTSFWPDMSGSDNCGEFSPAVPAPATRKTTPERTTPDA